MVFGHAWKRLPAPVMPIASEAPQIAMPIWARRKWSPMILARPSPAIGAAIISPKPTCLNSEVSVWIRICSIGASSALPAISPPSSARRSRPPAGASRSPGSVNGRIA